MIPAFALAVLYVVWAPPSADLAAQTFRADLFADHGLAVWTNAWYDGVHTLGYSLIFPPLGSALGIQMTGAVAAIAATVLFRAAIRPRYGDRARLAVALFGLGAGATLFSGRITFAVGLAIAMAAVLAVTRGRNVVAAPLAAVAAAASPVAGLFVGIAGVAAFIAGRRGAGVALAAPSAGVVIAMAAAFPTGGTEPFAFSAFLLIPIAAALLIRLADPHERELRIGAWVYLACGTAFLLVSTPVGGNVTRLGSVLAAPLLALATRRRGVLLVAALVPLVYWQLTAPVRDLADAVGDPSVKAGYYTPILFALEERVRAPARIEVPPSRDRWEAVRIAERFPLARGWMRQLESDDENLFQHGNLDAVSYRAWLDRHAVSLVAVPDAEPDRLARDEIALIDSGLPYLHRVWSDDHWRLYAVSDPVSLAQAPARVSALGSSSFRLSAPRAGAYRIAINPSPYWRVTAGDGCIRADESGDDAITVEVQSRGDLTVEAAFTLKGLARSEPRC